MAKEQVAKSVDILWDGWVNSLKSFQQLQDEVEKKTLQAFNYQKEIIDTTSSALHSIEEESKKATKEWQERVQNTLNEINNNGQLEQVSKWFESVQEITERAQDLAWKPSNTAFDVFTNTQSQWENTVKSALEQQKQEREETLKKLEELAEQLRDTHKRLLAISE